MNIASRFACIRLSYFIRSTRKSSDFLPNNFLRHASWNVSEHLPNTPRGAEGKWRRERRVGKCDTGLWRAAQTSGEQLANRGIRFWRPHVYVKAQDVLFNAAPRATAVGVSHENPADQGVQGQRRSRVISELDGNPCDKCGAFEGAALRGCTCRPRGPHRNGLRGHRIWPHPMRGGGVQRPRCRARTIAV